MLKLPSRPVQLSLIAIFLSFLVFQLFITHEGKSEWYPFSSYRMFSRNWQNNIVMERIRYKDPSTEKIYFPWALIKIPFFQANKISFTVFLDLNNESAKKKLCEIYNKPGLQVLREEVKYRLEEKKMNELIQLQEVVYECPR